MSARVCVCVCASPSCVWFCVAQKVADAQARRRHASELPSNQSNTKEKEKDGVARDVLCNHGSEFVFVGD